MELRGHIAVVTAGGAGLGRHVANLIAAHGAHVVIGDLDSVAGQTVVAEIERDGGRATFVKVDVTDDEQLSQMVARATELGPIGALVNNAGGWGASGLQYPVSTPTDWSNVLDLNLRAPMLATQLCLQPMKSSGGGAVVNVASSGDQSQLRGSPLGRPCPRQSGVRTSVGRGAEQLRRSDRSRRRGRRSASPDRRRRVLRSHRRHPCSPTSLSRGPIGYGPELALAPGHRWCSSSAT